jgi:NADH-quinone oxidoreductase subunit I
MRIVRGSLSIGYNFGHPCRKQPAAPNSPGERYAARYEINMLRCIFCGYCEDACPTNAIVLEHQYELSFYDRK